MNLRKLKAALWFIREIPWVDEPKWTAEDAKTLYHFLSTDTGEKLRAQLRNLVLRQQAEAVISESNLTYKCGSCSGSKSIIGVIEGLADTDRFIPGEEAG